MAIASLYPSINPSLLLDFANTKQLDPRITFTRTTTATYYDGVTTAKAEENLLTYSQEFDDASWTKGSVTVTANSATTAPDGTTTADLFYPSSTGTWRIIYKSGIKANIQYTLTVYAKASGFSNFFVGFDNQTTTVAWFNLTTGVKGTKGANITSSDMTSVGNGWYRCQVVFTHTSDSFALFGVADADNSSTATASGTNGALIWGAQAEQRSSATAYTATTTQAITNYIPVLQTASAGQARFDHNPTTGESLGLLIEEARTNSLTYSAQFDNAAWTKTNVTVAANTNVAPDGSLSADTITCNSGSTTKHVAQTISISSAPTLSVYVKTAGVSYIQILNATEVTGYANFDIATGVVGTKGSTASASSITSVGNGWYRLSVSFTIATGSVSFRIYAASSASDGYNPTTSSTGSFFIWGAQLEAGSFPTSYIATTSASVTRNADAASMTGTNFSSWFGGGNISIYAEAAFKGYVSNQGAIVSQVSDGSTNNNIDVYWYNGAPTYYVTSAGSNVINLGASAISANTFMKFSAANAFNDSAVSFNGAAIQTDTSCALPTGLNKLNIGNTQNYGAQYMSGWIKKLAYYPQRLTNTNLVALAS